MRKVWLLTIALTLCLATGESRAQWTTLEKGLDLARFDSGLRSVDAKGDLLVLRVDTDFWALQAHKPGILADNKGRSTKRWCESEGLMAAINAGMYQDDKVTHVGYFKINGEVINAFRNDYLSAVAIDPVDPTEPYFRIFDLDEITLGEVAARYNTVAQNMRLIKRAGENRWQAGKDRWQEAALGEDYKGRALLIFCDRRWSMHDFNEILMELPLGLVVAQHLEGRVEASMWVQHPAVDVAELPGNRKGHFTVPNILGVTKRHPQVDLPNNRN